MPDDGLANAILIKMAEEFGHFMLLAIVFHKVTLVPPLDKLLFNIHNGAFLQ